jgi:hypothetical protein
MSTIPATALPARAVVGAVKVATAITGITAIITNRFMAASFKSPPPLGGVQYDGLRVELPESVSPIGLEWINKTGADIKQRQKLLEFVQKYQKAPLNLLYLFRRIEGPQ